MFHSFYRRVLKKQWLVSRYCLRARWIMYATTQNSHETTEKPSAGLLWLFKIWIIFRSDSHVKPHDVTQWSSLVVRSTLLDAAELHKHQIYLLHSHFITTFKPTTGTLWVDLLQLCRLRCTFERNYAKEKFFLEKKRSNQSSQWKSWQVSDDRTKRVFGEDGAFLQ